eukprot:TRINITY_DN4609_c0_g1_i3.p1 TRINITY_DN4609_c0_g1~~TRINITY_DN4609_c0_g1_i3.p1  ORF type:complete len:498 (+),score=43.04 TRINITY_DN4609_c0_g1_i3:245-1738(+)
MDLVLAKSGVAAPSACLARSNLSARAFRSTLRSVPLPLLRPSVRDRQTRGSRLAARAAFDPLHIDAAVSATSAAAAAAHNLLFSVADAALEVTSAATDVVVAGADAATEAAAQSDGGWFSGLADILESFLKVLEQGLVSLNVPYAYGFSIILLTLIIKLATFPLTKKQVESTMAMQNLQPKLKAIQTKYAGDQERIQLETARLYKQAGVNPLAGCLPTLATLPVFIGLYQALSNVAKEGVLTEGFYWIPSLAGPTSIAARDSGSGTSWLFPFIDGAPPLGWADTIAYLVLPVLLVASQFYAMQIMQPPQSDDPAQKNTQAILKFLPLMIGWFSLSVPSGLSLYWFTNNILSTAQTIYLRKMGGAKPVVAAGATEIIDVGQAKRSTVVSEVATLEDKEKARGERFRKLKEAEEAKKAAKKAAEEAARAAAAKAAEERAQLQQMQAAKEDDDDDDDDDAPENGAAQQQSAASSTPEASPASGAPKRSRRSRRSRKASSS